MVAKDIYVARVGSVAERVIKAKNGTRSAEAHGPPNEMPVLTHQKNFPLLFSISF